MGRAALAIGGIALVGVGIAVGLGWWIPTGSQTIAKTIDRPVGQQIHEVQIDDVGSGNVAIRTGQGAAVQQTFHYDRRGNSVPGDAFHIDGDRLVLTDCGVNCRVDFTVIVPPGTTVTGKLTSGDLTIRDTGAVDVTATSGNVEVFLASAQDVHVQATSGDIEVVVPADRYRVTGDTKSGERRIDVPTDPAAPHVLDLSSKSGDVTARTT